MADEGNPTELTLTHVEAPGFRTVFANGAIFTGPSDGSKNWIMTFYSEGARILSETLVAADVPGAFKLADPPRIETQRLRRDEVCVIIPEGQLKALIAAVGATMKEGVE